MFLSEQQKEVIKGDVLSVLNGWVRIRQWYTGLRYKAPESSVWIYRGKNGVMAIADAKKAVMW